MTDTSPPEKLVGALSSGLKILRYLASSSTSHGVSRIAKDLDLNAKQDAQADEWAKHIANSLYPNEVRDAENWREQLTKRLVILPDNIFSFLVDTATEIRMRIRIDRKTRMVKKGALWSEENLPAETVLWGVMGISQAHDKSGQSAAQLSDCIPAGESNIQLGGKHTVGRGLCRLLIAASTTEQ